MLSDAQLQRVWEEMLSSQMRALYYADLATKYNGQHRLATWATLVFSSGAAATLLAGLPSGFSWVSLACALVAAVLSGYSLAMQVQKRAVEASDLYYRWDKLAKMYERLWENWTSDDAGSLLEQAEERSGEVSKASHQLPHRKALLEKWENHVVAMWKQRAAAQQPRAA